MDVITRYLLIKLFPDLSLQRFLNIYFWLIGTVAVIGNVAPPLRRAVRICFLHHLFMLCPLKQPMLPSNFNAVSGCVQTVLSVNAAISVGCTRAPRSCATAADMLGSAVPASFILCLGFAAVQQEQKDAGQLA